jgi:ribosomal protein S18 acetylase RimI-like enzyme
MIRERINERVRRSELGGIEYGLVEKKDVDLAARIYRASFPRRVESWFHGNGQGAQFHRDLMDLMRLAYGQTFFVARSNGRLIGYLVLTLPNTRIFSGLFREIFALRACAHALTGRYGFSFSVFGRALGALFAVPTSKLRSQLSDSPHIYVLAVDRGYTGRGVGSALIDQASSACRPQFGRMWLCVDVENHGAIRFYQRFGFRIVETNPSQHVMVRVFDAAMLGELR